MSDHKHHHQGSMIDRAEIGVAPGGTSEGPVAGETGGQRWGPRRFFSELAEDLGAGVRRLRAHPVFSLLVVLMVGVGIGATTATWSVVDAVLLEPLPYSEPERLVRVWETHPETQARVGVSSGDIVEWRARSQDFEGIAGWYVMGRTLRTEERPQVVQVAQVSADFFPLLGVQPLLGSVFTREQTARAEFNSAAGPIGTDPVVLLSHRVWQQYFGGDLAIVGRTLSLDRQRWRIVGVLPPTFAVPDTAVDLWIPWSFQGERPHDQRYLSAIARVRRGVTLALAQQELRAVASTMAADFPATNEGWSVELVPLHEEVVGRSRLTLLVLFGAVGCVLLIGCVNIANLQLVRLGARSREIALRLALGASRGRLARQLLTENLVLAVLGGALGLPVALLGLELVVAARPAGVPRLDELTVDPGILIFASVLTLASGLVFGLGPAVAARAARPSSGLVRDARLGVSGWSWSRLRSLLVVSEVALAMVLLMSAGLLVQSYSRLRATDPGFNPDPVLVMPIVLDSGTYDSGEKSRAYYGALIEQLAALPGVESVGGVTALPMSPIGPDFDRPIWRDGYPPPPGGARRADVRMATPDYFQTVGMPVLRGRGISERDRPLSPRVVVINETLARELWWGADPIGDRLVIDYSQTGTYPYQVVGVVSDIHFYGARSEPRAELYLPHAQRSYLIMNIVVRGSVEPENLVSGAGAALMAVDPDQPAHSIVPLKRLMKASVAADRLASLVLGTFASAALILAVLGIFGVVSHQAAQRTREVGIRAALGASPASIRAMIAIDSSRMIVAGIGVGFVLSLLSTRLLSGLLFGIEPLDARTLIATALVLAAGASLACYLPSLRASRVDPVEALRSE